MILYDISLKACRKEGFGGIDFPNSFVWGVSTVTTMAVPACTSPCTATDVVAGTSLTCTSIKEWYKIKKKVEF